MDSVASGDVEAGSATAPEGSALGTRALPDPLAEADVTVIATVLDEVGNIDAMLSSLLTQTLARAEIVIVDGGSADGTWERLERVAAAEPRLRVRRDETCRRGGSTGPIARGRNVAIGMAHGTVIACADAGCSYGPEWLARLTAPLREGTAAYALGGTFVDPSARETTVWDLAAAPFLGVKLRPEASQRSCTARSMAFHKELWRRAGGFPETTYLGEDTLFDAHVRALETPVFVQNAKARYLPRLSVARAMGQIWRYAVADGQLRQRPGRLKRNGLRCALVLLAIACSPWTRVPLFIAAVEEVYCAFQFDGRDIFALGRPVLWVARIVFSLAVPWLVTVGMLRGSRFPKRVRSDERTL